MTAPPYPPELVAAVMAANRPKMMVTVSLVQRAVAEAQARKEQT
jgi:hypothetical protein